MIEKFLFYGIVYDCYIQSLIYYLKMLIPLEFMHRLIYLFIFHFFGFENRIILFSNPGAEIATRACLAARVAANCEAGRYGEM